MARRISKHSEKRSSQPVVRTRREGTAVDDTRVPSDERGYIDVEVDASGKAVTDFGNQGT